MDCPSTPAQLEKLAHEVFETLARQFPVCLGSDEFHFYPHYRSIACDWSCWDDFSPEGVEKIGSRIDGWRHQLARSTCPPEDKAGRDMLKQVLTTLQEQLFVVASHRMQPSFYLTIISIGLLEAMAAGRRQLAERVDGLPAFVRQIIPNLDHLPTLFRDVALEMIPRLTSWLSVLPAGDGDIASAADALLRLAENLKRWPVGGKPQLSEDRYARVASGHMGCNMSLADIAAELDGEITKTRAELEKGAARLVPGESWQTVVANLRPDLPSNGNAQDLYANAIAQLKRHCLEQGMITPAFAKSCPVNIQTIPDHLLPVRSSAAFSMPPGHPPSGGTFFVLPKMVETEVPADYRLLSAHETFPGHHLLDSSRWRLTAAIRRPLEFPLFYEGWASFSEEILFDTGFFSSPQDHLIMAKRRFWRAVRGRTDLAIHTGERSLAGAAAMLNQNGMPMENAKAMVRRYALKPGYQLSYTIGRCKFRSLYDRFQKAGIGPVKFTRIIMEQGEVPFHHLEGLLTQKTNPDISSTALNKKKGA